MRTDPMDGLLNRSAKRVWLCVSVALFGLAGGLPGAAAGQEPLTELRESLRQSRSRLSDLDMALLRALAEDPTTQSTVAGLLGITEPVETDLLHLEELLGLFELAGDVARGRAIVLDALRRAEGRVHVETFERYLLEKERSRTFTPRAIQAVETGVLEEFRSVRRLYGVVAARLSG